MLFYGAIFKVRPIGLRFKLVIGSSTRHELIHAKTNIEGKNNFSPNGKGLKSFSSGEVLTQDEYDTRVEENKIREEQDVRLRKIGKI